MKKRKEFYLLHYSCTHSPALLGGHGERQRDDVQLQRTALCVVVAVVVEGGKDACGRDHGATAGTGIGTAAVDGDALSEVVTQAMHLIVDCIRRNPGLLGKV